MAYLDRFDRYAAEDGQRSVVMNGADARLLNKLDEVAKLLQEAREDNSDSEREVYLNEIQKMADDLKTNIQDGWV